MDSSRLLNRDVETMAAGRDEKKKSIFFCETRPQRVHDFNFGFDKLHAAENGAKDEKRRRRATFFAVISKCHTFLPSNFLFYLPQYFLVARATSLTRCQFIILPSSRKLNGILAVFFIWLRVKCHLCVIASFWCHRRHKMRSRQTNGIRPMNCSVLQASHQTSAHLTWITLKATVKCAIRSVTIIQNRKENKHNFRWFYVEKKINEFCIHDFILLQIMRPVFLFIEFLTDSNSIRIHFIWIFECFAHIKVCA